MAKKTRASIIGRLEHAASDVANALSVAATGSQIGVLEMAAEDEFVPSRSRKPKRKTKTSQKNRVAAKKPSTRAKKRPGAKRSKR